MTTRRLIKVVGTFIIVTLFFVWAVLLSMITDKKLDTISHKEFDQFLTDRPLAILGFSLNSLHEDKTGNPFVRYNPITCGLDCKMNGVDPGGHVYLYRTMGYVAGLFRERVEFNSFCNSSCTILADSLNQKGLACVGKRASFWFHLGFILEPGENLETGKRTYVNVFYSDPMRGLIDSKGGLKPSYTIIKYDDLLKVFPKC